MQNSSRRIKRASSRTAKLAVAASMVASPLLSTHSTSSAQTEKSGGAGTTESRRFEKRVMKYTDIYLKMSEKFTLAGMDEGHTIYKKKNGDFFYLDPNTGDMKSVDRHIYMKYHEPSARSTKFMKMMKFESATGEWKYKGEVSLVGVDASGHTVQKNSKGEEFYLDPVTGDMVFVK